MMMFEQSVVCGFRFICNDGHSSTGDCRTTTWATPALGNFAVSACHELSETITWQAASYKFTAAGVTVHQRVEKENYWSETERNIQF